MFAFACDHFKALEQLFLSIRPVDAHGLENQHHCDVS